VLDGLRFRSWACLEPDAKLAAQIGNLEGGRHRTVIGTTEDLSSRDKFDAILYIDVLEHIEDDRAEMQRATGYLRPGGALIVLSPAHSFLYAPFDAAIGHFRRYSRSTLREAVPEALHVVKLVYLDAAGMLASAANRLLLRSAMPTKTQILTWDRWMVPASRVIDPILGWRVGKTVLGVWRLNG
jgi:2-polyprenyl-3-methyl-5-hydroxy-6-metoxy-1,4-benzoquinol methylase